MTSKTNTPRVDPTGSIDPRSGDGRSRPARQPTTRPQRGGFAIGLIIGLLIGLTLALGVALYVTKVPIPFVNKVPQRTADQDAAENEKNRHWDPNGPLSGKNPVKPNTAASGTLAAPAPPPVATPAPAPEPSAPLVGSVVPASAPAPRGAASQAMARASAPASRRDPAAILSSSGTPAPPAAPRIVSTLPNGADPFSYFVQAGAYGRTEDAEQQRARLAMLGLEGRMTEREQNGRTVYRVRVGPFEHRDDAEAAKQKLDGAGVEAALVRVQR